MDGEKAQSGMTLPFYWSDDVAIFKTGQMIWRYSFGMVRKTGEATSRMAFAEQDQKTQVQLEKAHQHAQIFDILVKALN